MYSLSPVGELYHDEIRRTLEIGGRSDSRILYNVAQLIALRQGPTSPLPRDLYETWTFSDRGPLVGLVAAPLVLAGPTKLSNNLGEPWTVFNSQGFGAYPLLYDYFRRSLPVVRVWNHPAALLSVPALLGVIILLPPCKGTRAGFWERMQRWTKAAMLLFLGLAFWMGFWRAVNAGHYSQGNFLGYLTDCGNLPKTLTNWAVYRLDRLLNTFIPLNQFLFYSADNNVNSLEGPSPAVVRFYVQPWSSVRFAVGLAFFFYQLPLVYIGIKNAAKWFVLTLLVPLLVFAAYMRQPFVVTDVFALCVMITGTALLSISTFRIGEECRAPELQLPD
jgi:hypothetical protein